MNVAVADEIVIGNRPNQRTLQELGVADGSSSNTRLITAGELWQFFHNQGVTSVDRLTLNVDCGQLVPAKLGAIGFQIEDPINGHVLTNLRLDASNSQLEVPLEFDYMKRFSPGSKELIRLDLSGLEEMAQNATVTLNGEDTFFGPFNLVLVVGFLGFWIAVFVILNRFTRPMAQEEAEDIVVVSLNGENNESASVASSSVGPVRSTNSNVKTTSPRVAHSNMVSAQQGGQRFFSL
jgi:hypothetical protein